MFNLKQCGHVAQHLLVLSFLALSLNACTMSSNTTESGITDALDAATGSLEDLNLKRREIPALLKKLAVNPYQPPPKFTCKSIKAELAELEPLLGPDIKPREVEVASNDDSFMGDIQNMEMPSQEDAAHAAHDGIMGLIRDQTDILPFRSIIRRITGADRHQRLLEEAYQAGKLRRAYLKGLAESKFGKSCNTYSTIPMPVLKKSEEPSA